MIIMDEYLLAPYLFEHNPLWADWYLQTSQLIRSEVSVNIDLYHIGSTAIPNLMAKECIDILGVIENVETAKNLIEPLEKLGFEYRGEYGIKGRYYFAKKEPIKLHFHIFKKGSAEIKKHLQFIEVMSKAPELVQELNEIKRNLHSLYPNDKNQYQQGKSSFYQKRVLKSAN